MLRPKLNGPARVLALAAFVAVAGVAQPPAVAGGPMVESPLARLAPAPTRRTFLPTADSSVSTQQPRANFGRDPVLTLEGSPPAAAYVRFRVRGLSGNLAQARLRLFVLGGSGKFQVATVRSGSWSERGIAHMNAPRLTGIAGYAQARGRGWLELDLTGLVRGNGTLTFVLSRVSPQKLLIASREAGARSPRLVVETEPRAAPVVVAAGDIACGTADPSYLGGRGTERHCRMQGTSDVALNLKPNLALALGDNLNSPGTYDEFVSAFHSTWGRLKSRIRPVPGNWEYEDPGAAGYFRYFGGAAGDPVRGYYSHDVGSWHLVALNSNCAAAGGCGPGSPQEQWLRADLAASAKLCTLAYTHYPRFTTGSGGGYPKVDPLWRALADHGVELLLSGQKHAYERFAELDVDGVSAPGRGIRQFVVGTGGHSHGNRLAPRALSELRESATFGVLRLVLRPGSYDWLFVPVVGSTFTDRGSTDCH